MERMVRVWIDFEVELIGFANRLEGGCEKKRKMIPRFFYFVLPKQLEEWISAYRIGADFRDETQI